MANTQKEITDTERLEYMEKEMFIYDEEGKGFYFALREDVKLVGTNFRDMIDRRIKRERK